MMKGSFAFNLKTYNDFKKMFFLMINNEGFGK